MPQTWFKEDWRDRQTFVLSKDWLECMLTSFYLFIEGTEGDPDVQVI